MESLNSHMERVQWRRNKVMELSSQGNSQPEISKILQVGLGTVNRDLSYLRQQSRANIQRYNEQLPHEYEKCLMALTEILKESFDISHEPEIERKEKLQALSLIKEVISTKLELLTNCTVVDDVVKFIDNYKKRKEKEAEKEEESESRELSDNMVLQNQKELPQGNIEQFSGEDEQEEATDKEEVF